MVSAEAAATETDCVDDGLVCVEFSLRMLAGAKDTTDVATALILFNGFEDEDEGAVKDAVVDASVVVEVNGKESADNEDDDVVVVETADDNVVVEVMRLLSSVVSSGIITKGRIQLFKIG